MSHNESYESQWVIVIHIWSGMVTPMPPGDEWHGTDTWTHIASTRPVGFASGKNSHDLIYWSHKFNHQSIMWMNLVWNTTERSGRSVTCWNQGQLLLLPALLMIWLVQKPQSPFPNHLPYILYRGRSRYYNAKGSAHVLFWKLHHRGERGRKGRECKFHNKKHRTFGIINTSTPVLQL